MNITKNYIEQVICQDSLSQLLSIVSINDTIEMYLVPWIAAITWVSNMMVAILCAIIYLKTKKKSHKPAFVYIGFVAIIDMQLGG